MNYAVRITFPAVNLQAFFGRLSMVSEQVVVYEHSENCEKCHCHIVLLGYVGDQKNIKRWAEEALNLKIDKTKISIKSQYKPKGTVQSVSIDTGAISYASKGKYEPKYVKGFTVEELNVLKEKGFDKKDKPVKLSGDKEWYFVWETEFLNSLSGDTDKVSFYDLRSNVVSYHFRKLGIVNQNFKNKVKMCVQTYMITYGIKVPEGDKDAVKKYCDF